MIPIEDFETFDFDKVEIDPFWNTGSGKELKMHRIHSYPAKFPAFITTKALEYANLQEHAIATVADIFCGCGTTAFEVKRNNIAFWGCDINPVATLIARVKSHRYQHGQLSSYLEKIISRFQMTHIENSYPSADSRLKYWYRARQYNDLSRLKWSINKEVSARSRYLLFFLCAFSNILKPTSMWLTKSIKPQLDPDKLPTEVLQAFFTQCQFMIEANSENKSFGSSNTQIDTQDFLSKEYRPVKADLIITSPPYVTSYEYADLHQLSSLWLGYAQDYRDLRRGAVGSLYHDRGLETEHPELLSSGQEIVAGLREIDRPKARSVRDYFLDMQEVAKKAYSVLNKSGIALFVIGNTEYKGVRVNNAKHLVQSFVQAGFSKVCTTKRKITKKILTPYRDKYGRFSTDSRGRKVYSEEFIVAGSR